MSLYLMIYPRMVTKYYGASSKLLSLINSVHKKLFGNICQGLSAGLSPLPGRHGGCSTLGSPSPAVAFDKVQRFVKYFVIIWHMYIFLENV